MSSYYKATRPDGTDFYTGTVDYGAALASGDTIRLDSDETEFPGPGWLHLATVPTECDGMTWPCRLFEVEPVGEFHRGEGHPYKIGATSVRVLREIEAHRVFGPQGEQVVALIERCWALSAAEVDRLGAAWAAARDAALDATWNATWVAARYAALGAARNAAWYAAWDATRDATRDVTWAARCAAWAARCAAWALLCRDLTGQHDGWYQDTYDLLTGPWRQTIGPIHPDDGDSDD